MIKFLFLDYRLLETITGFTRRLEQPRKHSANPMFIADQPWENGNMELYGSVIKAPGKPFQLWYSCIHPPFVIYLGYAESDDGLAWRRPLFDIFEYEGKKTNIVFDAEPHGPAIIYDDAEPDERWRYKMMCGAAPSHGICNYHSADGIHWLRVRRWPVISTNPDCPMGFLRAPDGRYVAYHRFAGFGRRVFRSESHDFRYWTGEPRMVLEPDADDPTQTQFYGMGATAYGPYEIGTLWMYHTEESDSGGGKMRGYQEAELTYARSGYAWHRAAQGTPFIPHGGPDDWDRGNLQCASAPVFLDDEIRYYYMGTNMFHQNHWELEPQTAGIGMASLQPDRFFALAAGDEPAALVTVAWQTTDPRLFVNAAGEADGWLKVEVLEADNRPIPGLGLADCEPVTGDRTDHPVRWRGGAGLPTDRPIRLKVAARNARLYSLFVVEPDETPCYHKFRSPRPGW